MMIRRLDGSIKGPIVARRTVARIGVERRFAEPITRTDYALEILAELAAEANVQLTERHEGGRRWEARLFRADGLVQRLRIETGQPTRDVALLMRLFRERIDSLADPLDPGFGYDLLRLDVALAETLDASQLKLEGGEAQRGDVAQLVGAVLVIQHLRADKQAQKGEYKQGIQPRRLAKVVVVVVTLVVSHRRAPHLYQSLCPARRNAVVGSR